MKHYVVTAAIIIYQDKILCMQRPEGKYTYTSYKFEFPGGKVEEGESFEEGLSRELSEELNIQTQVRVENFFMTVEHTYPDFGITMHAYVCPVAVDTFEMKEHVQYQWLNVGDLGKLDWAEADIPIVTKLMEEGYHVGL